MGTISVELIEKAIHQFYNDVATQRETNQWLTEAQKSNDAWNFPWELLNPCKAMEVQFYGASTIYSKIRTSWHELHANHHESLKQKLMQWILNYSSGPPLILSKLCIAFATLMIKMIDHGWTSCINDVLIALDGQNLPQISPENLMKIKLEILTALPQQFGVMSVNYTGVHKNSINSGSKPVLLLLEEIVKNMENHSSDVTLSSIKCVNSWIQFGVDIENIEPFLPLLLKALHSDALCEASLEAFTSIIHHPLIFKYEAFVNKLIPCIINFEPVLNKAIDESDTETCNLIYGVVTLLCETQSKLLLEQFYADRNCRDAVLKLINIVLKCSGTPGQFPTEENCSQVAFSLWYILQEDAMSSEPEKTSFYLLYLVPIYKSLVEILLVKVRYPSDQVYSSWNAEEKNDLRCYRQDIGDTFIYCYIVLRESMLNILLSHITVLLQTADDKWQELEACLFAFKSISETIGIQENVFLPSYFSCLPKIPMTNPKLTATLLDSIGSFAEWIGLHPEVVGNIVPLLLHGLKHADVALSATMSLKELSLSCRLAIVDHAHTILTASQAALEDNILGNSEKIRLVATIGSVLSILPISVIMSYLNTIILPYIQKLEAYATQQPSAAIKVDLSISINVLSMLCLNLDTRSAAEEGIEVQEPNGNNEPLPVLMILHKSMPSLCKIGLLWVQDSDIIESLCTLLKRSCATLLDDFKPVLPTTLQFLLEIHQICPYCHCLDMAKQILLLFAPNESVKQLMQSFMLQLTNVTLSYINKDFRNSTDLIENFLCLLTRVLKKQLNFFVESGIPVHDLFITAISALCLPEVPTVKSASQFLSNFIICSREHQAMCEAVNNNGEVLLGYIFKIIGGEAPRTMVDFTPDILLALNKKYFDNFCRWMNVLVNDGNLPLPSITRLQKEHYSRLIIKERWNKRKLLEIVKEYTFLCRGLIGTEYAKQTF